MIRINLAPTTFKPTELEELRQMFLKLPWNIQEDILIVLREVSNGY